MITTIKTGVGISDQSPDREPPDRRPSRRERDNSGAEPVPEPADEPSASDLRLVIEPDPSGGDYVYKLVDRATGQVVAERPRGQVANLAQDAGYRTGSFLNTKA